MLSLSAGWTSVGLPLLPLALLAGVGFSLFDDSAVALRSSSDGLVSSTFSATSGTDLTASFTRVTCESICSCVAFSSANTFLASAITKFSFAFLASSVIDATLLSNSSKAVFKSVTFAFLASSVTFAFLASLEVASSEVGFVVVAVLLELPVDLLSPDESPPPPATVWCVPSAAADAFSAAWTVPLPKKSKDATATLAAPKWYFLIEKRVNFSLGCLPSFMKCSPFLWWWILKTSNS